MDLNIDYVERLATRVLPLDTWGFVESMRTESFLIYNSQWCRLRFNISVDHHNKTLWLGYGRLHALGYGGVMKWMGENCYCWHDEAADLKRALQYLDGLTPEAAYKTRLMPLKLFEDFKASVLANTPNIDSYELNFKRHAMMWDHYGLRFFELFDLRRPDLWNDYLAFLKEFYRLMDEEFDSAFARQGVKRERVELPRYRKC